jgi:hypothetical protein
VITILPCEAVQSLAADLNAEVMEEQLQEKEEEEEEEAVVGEEVLGEGSDAMLVQQEGLRGTISTSSAGTAGGGIGAGECAKVGVGNAGVLGVGGTVRWRRWLMFRLVGGFQVML